MNKVTVRNTILMIIFFILSSFFGIIFFEIDAFAVVPDDEEEYIAFERPIDEVYSYSTINRKRSTVLDVSFIATGNMKQCLKPETKKHVQIDQKSLSQLTYVNDGGLFIQYTVMRISMSF